VVRGRDYVVLKDGWRLVTALVVVCVLLCGVAGTAIALPTGRQYELVSPVFKDGFGATHIEAVASDGEGVAFYSPGSFEGAPAGLTAGTFIDYLARRTSSGWKTVPLMPPASLLAHWERVDLSPSLELMLAIGEPGTDSENGLLEADVFLHPTSLPDIVSTAVSGWQQVGEVVKPVGPATSLAVQERGADPDFCHLVLQSNELLLTEATGEPFQQRYEFNRGCSGEPASLRLLGVNNHGTELGPGCIVNLGVEAGGYADHGQNTFNAVSVDGSEKFFTDCVNGQAGPHQLFVRLGGARTVEVSKPVGEMCSKEVPCTEGAKRPSAEFVGASEDGSRVYFTAPLTSSQSPLVPGDADASNNLYMATIGCPEGKSGCAAAEREVVSLTDVSHDPNGGAANVAGVLRVAPDGQRTYFVAGGDLLNSAQQQVLASEGRTVPQVGAENLYVYNGTSSPATIGFIGDLCTGYEASGSAQDIHCPGGDDVNLWSTDYSESQTAGPDGRFLVFATYAQLGGGDANAGRDVYRYDAERGKLERVSIGEGGYGANGNGGSSGAQILVGNHGVGTEEGSVRTQYEMNSRAIDEEGSRIVFYSAEPLSPLVSNGLDNAYEWHENPDGEGGSVALVSSGSGEEPVDDVVISPNGLSVFFDTVEGLVPQDVDGAPDVYDARLDEPGEAFPPAEAKRRPCEGDACQGPLTNPASLLVPGSVAQAPGQNLAPPVRKAPAKPKCKRGYKRDKRGGCVKTKKASKAGKGIRRGSTSKSIGGKKL
jgi:hypothetical protein